MKLNPIEIAVGAIIACGVAAVVCATAFAQTTNPPFILSTSLTSNTNNPNAHFGALVVDTSETVGQLTASTNINAGYGTIGSQATVSAASVQVSGTTSGNDLTILSRHENTHGPLGIFTGYGGNLLAALTIGSTGYGTFGNSVTVGGTDTNGVPDLVVKHNASSLVATNVLEVQSGSGVIRLSVANNGFTTVNGNAELTGVTTIDKALTLGATFTVPSTNTAPVSTSSPVAWWTLTTTNGASFRIPLYQ